jgi:putative flippase GtrA
MQWLEPFGKWLIIGGIALVITGGLFLLLSKLSGVRHLPCTFQVEAGA